MRFCYPVTLYLGGKVITGGYGAFHFVCGAWFDHVGDGQFFSDYLLVLIVGKVQGRRFVTYDCRPGTPVRGSVRKGEAAEEGQLAQERTDEDENQRGDILRT